MIKAIIFDYFGVISSDEYWNLVKKDKNVDSDFMDMANRVNLGTLHWRDFMQTVADKTGQTFEQVKSMYESERINPQVLALAKELHEDYKTGLLTNAHHEFLDSIVKKAKLDDVFDCIVVSSRVGHIKPDMEIFKRTLQELSVSADEAVFIDDITRNVEGAKAAGLHAIHYKSLDQLKKKLSDYLRR